MNMKIEAGMPADVEKRAPSERAVYRLLDSLGVEYGRIDHDPLFTIEECKSIDEMIGVELCKNLFLCDRGQNRFYLLLLPGEKRFVTRVFSPLAGDSRLAFATEDKMREFLGLTPGSVSVLGLMNDTDGRVKLFIDREILEGEYFACHPCVNTSSLVLRTEDLIKKILPAVGHGFTAVELP